ncbi:zinc-finger homeodomain protein 4-like [Magnolia sinica]|uniref:zinc-finger homeodomain protein 4-like n=1 Tax=Magnolia sinica TaxID=86752 RepID=UPI00265A643A|nr:zinc-finger homeodomain protein 4-like [Magnolia sinica]
MDISTHEVEIPIPISSSYAGGGHGPHVHAHMIHDPHHIIPSSATQLLPSNGPIPPPTLVVEDHTPYKKSIRYKECLKNHAAAMGGNATDGCGEFMPGGEEGTLEALKCSACSCHRNFHRKDIEGDPSCDLYHHLRVGPRKVVGQKGVLIAGPDAFGYPTAGSLMTPRPTTQMIMSYNLGGLPSESDEQEGGGGAQARHPMVKKRFRTKFTAEQKEKMLEFADKVGWRIQKQEEGVVQQFCQEIGVKRRVLKVWMHNNKHNLAKKVSTPTSTEG